MSRRLPVTYGASCMNAFQEQIVHDMLDFQVSQIVEETVEVVRNVLDWYCFDVR